jgi:hypothetical protein
VAVAAQADFTGRFGPWAQVAGASEGLGAEFSRQLADRGLDGRPDATAPYLAPNRCSTLLPGDIPAYRELRYCLARAASELPEAGSNPPTYASQTHPWGAAERSCGEACKEKGQMDSRFVDQQAIAPAYSPDGRWWWDGQRWRSLDGASWWDGGQWQAVPLQPARSSGPGAPAAQSLIEFFLTKPPVRSYGNVRRFIFGTLWTFFAVVLGPFFLFSVVNALVQGMTHPERLFSASTAALVMGLMTFLAGSYAYRIWTWRARMLLWPQ